MAKSKLIAFVLWFFGGSFGLHHFYLGRDGQAFIWWATLGGCLGAGWLRDITRISTYVDDANDEPEFMEDLVFKMRKKPAFNGVRFCGQLAVGILFGALMQGAIPEDLLEKHSYLYFLIPYAIALGVHLVGNVGREKTSLKVAICTAYAVFLPSFFYSKDPVNLNQTALLTSILVNFKGKEWRRTPRRRRHCCKRLLVLAVCGTIYLSMWTSLFLHNAYVTLSDGKKVRMKDAVQNFFDSPAWKEMKATMRRMWDYYQEHGFNKMWEEFVVALDPEGELSSYKILGVSENSTDAEITRAYRDLAKKHHPDKVKDPKEKDAASDRFIKIQQAYESLMNIRNRKKAKRGKHRDEF